MPDKEGSDEKSTKSVVSKKQKQMMGEEGYDIARDMGRVRPSKDKKDATTMPVSDEVKKTQKVNKGPSALELVKKKYGKAVMNVGKKKANEELDLTKVAEAFGGYIILEQEFSDKQRSDMRKLLNKNFGSQEKSKETAGKLIKDKAEKDVEKVQGGRTVKKKINPNVSKGSGEGVIGKKDAKKGPELPNVDLNKAYRETQQRFRKDAKGTGATGDFSPTMPTQLRKVRQAQRDARTKKLGTPDPFSVDTSTAAADVAKQLGTKPVAGGLPMDSSTGLPNVKREPIPKDSGAFRNTPRVKKRFSQLSQDIKDLKRDVKVDKDIESTISRVDAKKGPELPNVDLNKAYRENQKARQQPSNKNASNDPSFKISGAKGSKDVQLPKFSQDAVSKAGGASRTFVQNVTRPRTRGERIQSAAVNTALKTMIPGLAGAQAGLEVSQGKYKDATLSAVQAMGGPIGFGAGVLRAVRQFRGTDAPRSTKTRRNPPVNIGVNRKTGVRDILQGPNQPPSFDIKGAKGPKSMKDVELPKVPQKERMKQGFDKNKENIKSKRGKPKNTTSSGSDFVNKFKKGSPGNPEISGIDFPDNIGPGGKKGGEIVPPGGKGGALTVGGALATAPLKTLGLTALGSRIPRFAKNLKGMKGVKGGKAIQVSAGK